MGVVVRPYIMDILIIIITFPNSTCISSFFGGSIPTSLFIFKMFFTALQQFRVWFNIKILLTELCVVMLIFITSSY